MDLFNSERLNIALDIAKSIIELKAPQKEEFIEKFARMHGLSSKPKLIPGKQLKCIYRNCF